MSSEFSSNFSVCIIVFIKDQIIAMPSIDILFKMKGNIYVVITFYTL